MKVLDIIELLLLAALRTRLILVLVNRQVLIKKDGRTIVYTDKPLEANHSWLYRRD